MRFLVNQNQIEGNRFVIDDSKVVNHIRKSLRLKSGDEIELFDGEGTIYKAELEVVANDFVNGFIKEGHEHTSGVSKIELALGQALPKAGKLDEIIRMNTEIGVSNFLLFDTEYGVVSKDKYNEKKLERLRRVAAEASRQSERIFIPNILGPSSFLEVLEVDADVKLLLHSRDTNGSIDISEVKSQLSPGMRVVALIGPEGGFSPKEIKSATDKGFLVSYLNFPILRTQTAGIVVSSILLY